MNEPVTPPGTADRWMQRLAPVAGDRNNAVLTAAQFEQLNAAAAAIRARLQNLSEPAQGAVVLFAGPGGTGKTMAAQVLAHQLGVDVLRVDVTQVLSKYIGETEKNLSAVFDSAAARANPILFFDEGDALFGKRSEVKDSHDRYANTEVNYLLQRAAQYKGVVVLACRQCSPIAAIKHVIEFQS